MNLGDPSSVPKSPARLSILLVDGNVERRALRKKILDLRGIEVIAAGDLTEASSIWHPDRYDLVLMDIRSNHYGCMAWRNEIKKENPKQIVAFLVGPPRFVDLEPVPHSYMAEEHGTQWGDSMRQAVREACGSLPQRNGFVEVGYRIAVARQLSGLPPRHIAAVELPDDAPEPSYVANSDEDVQIIPGQELPT